MRTLRARLILSHILPLVLAIPLVFVVLVYILETQVLLAGVSEELVEYGEMTAQMAQQEPAIWTDSSKAQHFASFYSLSSQSQVMLFDSKGNLLASSEPGYAGQIGQPVSLPNLAAALQGEPHVQVNYTQNIQAEVVQVLVPIIGPDQKVRGVVRLSSYMSDVYDQLIRLRYLIAAVLGIQLLLAVGLALILALNLGRSLRQVTDAIYGIASGREWRTLPEEGPEEIRTLLAAFNTFVERLRLLEESRRHLLANLVHELGRPIGALQSGIHAMLGGADQDPELSRELLEGMDTQVQRLRPLLDSLTDLHSQVLGTLELNIQPIELETWLRQMVAPWRQSAHEKGLYWRLDLAENLPVVEVDSDRLAQALGNLVNNAIKYTPDGTISVEAGLQEGQVSIAVVDTGIGVAPSEQDQIFEPFYRSRRDKRFPQGMGLGLSIARDLVVAHGGQLVVESSLEAGSRFVILLPASAILAAE